MVFSNPPCENYNRVILLARVPRKKYGRQKWKPEKKSNRFLRLLLGSFLLGGAFLVVAIFFNPLVWRLNLRAELEKSKVATTVYDRNGEPVATLYSKTRLWVPIDAIPEKLREAFIATEDYRFYQHKGIDPRGILRALYRDIREGSKVQGGSTITQQLVKTLFFTHEKHFLRKIWEMAYAIRIEQQYSKRQILEFYLNSIYLGHGSWGVQGAAGLYFGKDVRNLNTTESALVAALARSPEYYSPFRHPEAALKRRNLVLRLMAKHGYLRQSEYQSLTQFPLAKLANPGAPYVGAYFADYAIDLLSQKTHYSEGYLRSSGMRIYTTMDRRIQAAAETAIRQLPAAGPDRWGVIQPQGAMVTLDPKTGEILALVGGRRYSAAEVNRAFQIHRQPGSAIKPFLFAAAMEAGYRPDSMFVDQPLEIDIHGKKWRPQNYDNKYRGPITLREALEESVNTVAVELTQSVGPGKVYALARRMGLDSLVAEGELNDVGLAPLALGGLTKGVTLLELTGAYSSLANHGIRSVPFGVLRAYDHRGKLIYHGGIRQEQVIEPKTAADLTSMMAGVITRGTGIQANIGAPAAGKTGTTNKNTNGWFIGYTDQLLTGVWIGNDLPDKPLIVKGVALGSGMAAAIWGNLMRRTLSTPAGPQPYWPDREIFESY
jgi:penicillin-binding protein 1A